jgi:NTP pyrophosphatase (non-canonical NTP hydrolase)
MNAYEYAPLARRTLKEMPDFRQHMIHMGMGIAGEIGELIDAAKKVLVYGKPYDHTNTVEEVGDTLWYIANLLPELQVEPVYMQRSLDRGYTQGLKIQQHMKVFEDGNLGETLLGINKAVADKCADLSRLHPLDAPGTSFAVQYIEVFAGNVGVICGMLGVDSQDAMRINIEKLAKRYGDKYSDVAALNRDLQGERSVLEGGGA